MPGMCRREHAKDAETGGICGPDPLAETSGHVGITRHGRASRVGSPASTPSPAAARLGPGAMCATLVAPMSLKRAGIAVAALLVLGAAPQNPLVRARAALQPAAVRRGHRRRARGAGAPRTGGRRRRRARPRAPRALSRRVGRGRSRRGAREPRRRRHEPSRRRAIASTCSSASASCSTSKATSARRPSCSARRSAARPRPAPPTASPCSTGGRWRSITRRRLPATPERRRIYARMLDARRAGRGRRPAVGGRDVLGRGRGGRHGRFGRAWHAAIAAWVRAPLAAGPRAIAARRSRAARAAGRHPGARGHAGARRPIAKQTIAAMQSEWNAIKEMGLRR